MAVDKFKNHRKQMLRARAMRKGGKGKHKKRKGPTITRKRMIKAIQGSFGVKTEIAHRLGVGYHAVVIRLKQWPDLEEMRKKETDILLDKASTTMADMVTQRQHLPTALGSAKWILERQGGFEEKKIIRKTVRVTGGKNPIRIESQNQHIHSQAVLPTSILDLPLNLKKKILSHIKGNVTKILKVRRVV